MAKLTYITRGQKSPNGLPRVWICAHPWDKEKALSSIAADILDAADCAIWYSDAADTASKDELEEMQLFVVAVTTALLTENSAAMECELPVALKGHIPVLPIMLEDGLDALFAERLGSIEYLSVKNTPNGVPYKERLKKYLDAVLVGDTLAEQIRSAFDAYIFLSYRKKDRALARELMELIHRNDFCRDIAIWYDEYLVPGENFNDAICDAMKRSSLFALAVTPSILEPNNYVMNVEYPEVMRMGVPVLPALLAPTDADELRSSYAGIADLVDARGEGFRDALAVALSSVERRGEDDAVHRFFIGLAYLSGIDVETNKEKGRLLIHGAAEEGVLPAIGKLVSMYRTGDGVERDPAEAAAWQSRLCDRLCEQLGETDDSGLYDYLSALYTLGELYLELEDPDGAQRALERITSLAQEKGYPDKTGEIAVRAAMLLADAMRRSGRLGDELRLCRQALALSESVYAEDSPERLGVAYEANMRLWKHFSERGRLDEQTLEYAELARRAAEAIYGLDGSFESWSRLYDYNVRAAERWSAQGNTQLELELLAERVGMARERLSVETSDDVYRMLCRALTDHGGRVKNTAECRESREIAERLSASLPTVENLELSARSATVLAGILEDRTEAEELLREAVGIREKMLEMMRTPAALRALVYALFELGRLIAADADRYAEGKGYCVRAVDLMKNEVDRSPIPDNLFTLSNCYYMIGELCRANGEWDEVREYMHLRSCVEDAVNRGVSRIRDGADIADAYTPCYGVEEDDGTDTDDDDDDDDFGIGKPKPFIRF